jgi:hypothetical protein
MAGEAPDPDEAHATMVAVAAAVIRATQTVDGRTRTGDIVVMLALR